MLTHFGLAGKRALDGPRHGGDLGRRVRELAAALSRHGPDRRVARLLLFRRAALRDVADQLPRASGHLAVDHAQIPRDVFGRAELRVRTVREPHPDEKDLEGLDLSSLRFIVNGAEPISPQTLRRFTDRFARYGMDKRRASRRATGLRKIASALCFPPFGRGPQIDRIKRECLAQARLCGAGRRRTIPTRSRSSRAAIRSRRTRCASWTTPATRSASVTRACWNSAALRSPRAISATRRRPESCSTTAGSRAATAPTWRAATSTSPGA